MKLAFNDPEPLTHNNNEWFIATPDLYQDRDRYYLHQDCNVYSYIDFFPSENKTSGLFTSKEEASKVLTIYNSLSS